MQRETNTLSVTVQRRGAVKVSFFGVPRLRRVGEIGKVPVTGLRVASLLDLAGTKAAVVQRRAEAKDYIDIAAILSEGSVNLPLALASAQAIYGAQFNPQNTLKALVFFEEGNLKRLSQEVKKQLVEAVRRVDLADLPHLAGKKLNQGTKAVRQIPLTPETARIAKRIIWFEPPAVALSDPVRFMAYAMARASHKDMQVIRRYVSWEDFLDALDKAPPGIIDARSWAYWNLLAGRYPPPPMPKRQL